MLRVRAVIIQNGKVLALERHKSGEHFWCFPGGGIERNESAKEALIRECLEEANIEVRVGKKIYHQNYKEKENDFYLCEIVGGKVGRGNGPEYHNGGDRLNVYEPAWLPIKDLHKYDLRPSGLRDNLTKL